jgi:N-methylhydantoinase B
VSLRSAGGGGWGSPLERDPKLVQWDVKNEYITIETARNVYGVVLDPKTLEINMEETKRLREEMKKKGVSSPLNLLIFLRFQRTQCFLF